MISTVCQSCGHIGPSKYVTFCDGCGLEVEGEDSININGVGNKQGHFHKKCTPEFTVLVSATSAKCGLCGAHEEAVNIGARQPLDMLKHDLKLHGYKVP